MEGRTVMVDSAAVKKYLREDMDAMLVGIAPVDRFAGAPRGHHPGDFLPDAASVVIIGMPILRGLMRWGPFLEHSEIVPDVAPVSDNPNDGTWKPRRVLLNHLERRCAYEAINDDLQRMSLHLACFLEEAGFESIYLPTTFGCTHSWNPSNPKPIRGFAPFSHRHAAVAAGLGQFGKSNLLMTRHRRLPGLLHLRRKALQRPVHDRLPSVPEPPQNPLTRVFHPHQWPAGPCRASRPPVLRRKNHARSLGRSRLRRRR